MNFGSLNKSPVSLLEYFSAVVCQRFAGNGPNGLSYYYNGVILVSSKTIDTNIHYLRSLILFFNIFFIIICIILDLFNTSIVDYRIKHNAKVRISAYHFFMLFPQRISIC